MNWDNLPDPDRMTLEEMQAEIDRLFGPGEPASPKPNDGQDDVLPPSTPQATKRSVPIFAIGTGIIAVIGIMASVWIWRNWGFAAPPELPKPPKERTPVPQRPDDRTFCTAWKQHIAGSDDQLRAAVSACGRSWKQAKFDVSITQALAESSKMLANKTHLAADRRVAYWAERALQTARKRRQ
jgi:hypothetical protein